MAWARGALGRLLGVAGGGGGGVGPCGAGWGEGGGELVRGQGPPETPQGPQMDPQRGPEELHLVPVGSHGRPFGRQKHLFRDLWDQFA